MTDAEAFSCTPGELFCVDKRQRARCNDSGDDWDPIGICHIPNACDPATVTCMPILCTGGAGFCPETTLTGMCNDNGTGFQIGVSCDEGSSCSDATGACEPWLCQPDALSCGPEGGLIRCWADGLGEYEYEPCDAPGCVTCVHAGKAESTCEGVAPGDPPAVTECSSLEACFMPHGCRSLDCPKLMEACEGGAHELACEALSGCLPLPPQGLTTSQASSDITQLSVSFSVGTAADGASQFVTINPIINPQSGAFLGGLVPMTQIDGVDVGNIELTEDGVAVELECVPLLDAPEARSDLVFVIDATGSMEETIATARSSAIALAEFLADEGLDMRFGAVEFRDEVGPPDDTWFFDLDPDAQALEAFISTVNADGGGDEPENPIDAMQAALDHMSWRPGATRVMVLFTDASMHVPADGALFAHQGVVELVTQMLRYVTVHTVSSSLGGEICFNSVNPNPRLLSCATGGTASRLETFNVGQAKEALFAKALAQSHHCTFTSADPEVPHDIEVRVRMNHNGALLEGAALQPSQAYQ